MPLAHSNRGSGRHDLEQHLQVTGNLAAAFSDKFGAAAWGRLAGVWHDLGKYDPEFQTYLGQNAGEDAHLEKDANLGIARVRGPEHSIAGAVHAIERLGPGMAGSLPIASRATMPACLIGRTPTRRWEA